MEDSHTLEAERLGAFIARWQASGAAERAHKDMFLLELCDVLGLPHPDPWSNDPDRNLYVFEGDSVEEVEGGKLSTGRIDLFKDKCFVLEAKQGSVAGAKKVGTARRGTPGWVNAMEEAKGQALGYAKTQATPPPFLIVPDIGYSFDLFAAFDGSTLYRPYPLPGRNRLFFKDLALHTEILKRIWTDPMGLDPSRNAARVTREIALHLGELARSLEASGHGAEKTSSFLMRAIFTMFAEDVGLLKEGMFTKLLEDQWVPSPSLFVPEVEQLWQMMEVGGHLPGIGRIRKFNGGFFKHHEALPLTQAQLRLLLEAAKSNWTEVEPAIFGTLLERALDPKERHALGAHFTPRAYVERLVQPTIEEPLREDWDLVRTQVHVLIQEGKVKEAKKALLGFHEKLCRVRVLDPACGTGNFLYVALDLLKRLEFEVLSLLSELGEKQSLFGVGGVTVAPSQFCGIEIDPRARNIAELVLWIGFLRWQFRNLDKGATLPEPVLHDYGNIECRDAVLAWDKVEPLLDGTDRPVTRWDGETTKAHPVTGEQVPDQQARTPVVKYVSPKTAVWPEADFIVGNPPFLGGWRMRAALGDGYVEALWKISPGIPEKADLVMYWWDRAAALVRAGRVRRFGLITTNSVTQVFQRRILERHLTENLSLSFAIADHPWVDTVEGAAVRIAMTVGTRGFRPGRLLAITREKVGGEGVVEPEFRQSDGRIHANLTIGADLPSAVALRANEGITTPGVQLYGDGFIVTPDLARSWGAEASRARRAGALRKYLNARDLLQTPRGVEVIDFFGLTEEEARREYPAAFQHVLLRVKPERDQNRRDSIRRSWWRFGWERPVLRDQIKGLTRFIITAEISKHRIFAFLDAEYLPDNRLTAIASEDSLLLGSLSSRPHCLWALRAGGTLEDRPVYTKSACFDPFPFPVCTSEQAARVRNLGDRLDAHRKKQQAAHPGLTITGAYNVLEKLRSGEPLTAKEKDIHEQGLVSILKQIHDDLDEAVFEAYGWSATLSDEEILERLVALNAERAEEERRGVVRWLRPEFQNPGGAKSATYPEIEVEVDEDGGTHRSSTRKASPWPKSLPERISLVRDLALRLRCPFTLKDVAGNFRGARTTDVETVLDSLAALGLLRGFETPDGRRWTAAGK